MARINVEGALVELLSSSTSRPAATAPDADAARFYVVRRVGGPARLRGSDHPLFVVEAYAKGGREDHAIADLNEARELLEWLRQLGGRRVMGFAEVGGPGNLPDPRLPTYARYTATFEMHLR